MKIAGQVLSTSISFFKKIGDSKIVKSTLGEGGWNVKPKVMLP